MKTIHLYFPGSNVDDLQYFIQAIEYVDQDVTTNVQWVLLLSPYLSRKAVVPDWIFTTKIKRLVASRFGQVYRANIIFKGIPNDKKFSAAVDFLSSHVGLSFKKEKPWTVLNRGYEYDIESDICFVGNIKYNDGLGKLILVANALRKQGINSSFVPTAQCDYSSFPDRDFARYVRRMTADTNSISADSSLFTYLPQHQVEHLVPEVKGPKIAYVMWESDKLPSDAWKNALHSYDHILVPAPFMLDVLRSSNVDIPATVVPMGVVPPKICESHTPGKVFVFGSTGSATARKNLAGVIQAFQKAFPKTDKSVRLVLQSRWGDRGDEVNLLARNDSRITFINRELSNKEHQQFWDSLDCYVSLSKAEGYGLTPREAILKGIPTIVSDNSGHETIPDEYCYKVNTIGKEKAYADIYTNDIGLYWTPDLTNAAKHMAFIKDHYDIAKKKAEKALEDNWGFALSYEVMAKEVAKFLRPEVVILDMARDHDEISGLRISDPVRAVTLASECSSVKKLIIYSDLLKISGVSITKLLEDFNKDVLLIGAYNPALGGDNIEQVSPKRETSLSPRSKKASLLFESVFRPVDGYGNSAEALALAMAKNDPGVRWSTLLFIKSQLRFAKPNSIQLLTDSLGNIDFDSYLLYLTPNNISPNFSKARQLGVPIGISTMFETTQIPSSWPDKINNNFDYLVVPTEFGIDIHRNSGVTIPIMVSPLGVDTSIWPRLTRNRSRSHKFKFLLYSNGQWINPRKNADVVLKAFRKAFPTTNEAELIIKTLPGPKAPPLRSNEKVIPLNLYQSELLSLLQDVDCLVFPSAGEGYGLPPREAMSTGLPVIISNWSALTEIACEDIAYPVNPRGLIPACIPGWLEMENNGSSIFGEFANIHPDDVAEQMRYVYENQDEARLKGLRASEFVHNTMTYDIAAKKLLETVWRK